MSADKSSRRKGTPLSGESRVLPAHVISTLSFNPPMRTTDAALRGLQASIAERGILTPLIVIGNNDHGYHLVDGHRRFAAGKSLGITEFRCECYDVSVRLAPEMWANANKDTRQITTREWADAWYRQENLPVPKRIMSHIQETIRILGNREGVRFLLDNKTDPSIVLQVKMLARALASKSSLGDPPDERVICLWMVKHRTRGIVAQLIKAGHTPYKVLRKIMVRINKDAPFTAADLIVNGES